MKFSTFAGVATLFSGAMAAPHAGAADVAVHAKRIDIGQAIGAIENEVTGTIADAKSIAELLNKASGGDIAAVTNITTELTHINRTLTDTVDLLHGLGLGITGDVVGVVGNQVNGVGGGLLTAAADLLGDVLGEISSLLGSATSLVPGAKTAETAALATTADVNKALDSLADSSNLTALIGSLVSTVGSLLNNITLSIKAGTLGNVNSLAASADAGVDLTLQGLLNTIASLLNSLLHAL